MTRLLTSARDELFTRVVRPFLTKMSGAKRSRTTHGGDTTSEETCGERPRSDTRDHTHALLRNVVADRIGRAATHVATPSERASRNEVPEIKLDELDVLDGRRGIVRTQGVGISVGTACRP